METIIEFKGIRLSRIHNKSIWVYGGFARQSNNQDCIVVKNKSTYNGCEPVQIKQGTACQFSGLFDSNDDCIYRGDKIKVMDGSSCHGEFYVLVNNGCFETSDGELLRDAIDNCEYSLHVSGNIYL